jgi:hypothetical protein
VKVAPGATPVHLRVRVWQKNRLSAVGRQSKKTAFRRLLLFDLGFFVDHVLAGDGIVLPGLHLFGMQSFVLRGRVEVTGIGTGNEFDFVTHGRFLGEN